MFASHVIFLFILLGAMAAAFTLKKLTFAGTIAGGAIATALYLGYMFIGVSLLATFFTLAVLATTWRRHFKFRAGLVNESEKRDAYQVFANGGVAGVLGLINLDGPFHYHFYATLMAASLASATADTLSSELGTVYGKRFYNIITFKPDEKGRDGVISLEGTLIGIAGSTVIAGVFSCWIGWGWCTAAVIIAGTAGNLFDSILGATLERNGYIKNNLVNFLNTAFASLVAFLLLFI